MAESILTVFRRNSLKWKNAPCLHYKEGGQWVVLSWNEAEEKVRRYALGLCALGVKPGQAVAIWSKTRVEWTLLDLAVLACGGIVVPIYPSLTPEQVAYILKDAGVTLVVAEHKEQGDPLCGMVPSVAKVVVFEGTGDGKASYDLNQLVRAGGTIPANRYDEQLKTIQPAQTASVIYTSGTTGKPKGAIISHKNILAEVEALQAALQFQSSDIGLMCLPLAHVLARAMQFYQLALGCQAAYAEGIDRLAQNMQEIHPHFLLAVPRLLEKVMSRVEQQVALLPKTLQKLAHWGEQVGMETSEIKQRQQSFSWYKWARYQAAYGLVLRKLRARLGGELRVILSGGAPLAKEIAQFFHGHGIQVLEGYGLTETFAAITLNRPDDYRFGTVGKPIHGVRIKLASDGEICVKGDVVFSGYLHLKEETQNAFDEEGWLLTGDIGDFTKDGFVRITDRKKDLIITSGGKNISPQHIEALLKQSPYVSQAFVYGDGCKFISVLVTLDEEVVQNTLKKQGVPVNGQSLAKHPEVERLIARVIEEINRSLASFESIKKFAILDHDFSIEGGELTPTMKVKRKVVSERYQNILENFYRE